MLGERIKQLRTARNINQNELSLKLGISKQTVSNWENNNIQPSIDTLIKLARFFSVSTDYLLDLDIEMQKTPLDTATLTNDELHHIQLIINDIRKSRTGI